MPAATEMHRKLAETWNRRDFEAFADLLHPEYTYTGPDGKETPGRETGVAIARMYAAAFPDGVLEVVRVFTDGDTAIAEMRAHGTHQGDLMGMAPTGRRMDINICNVMEVRDGKVYREREYMDQATMMSQLGGAGAAA